MKNTDTGASNAGRLQQIAQQAAKPVDWNKLLKRRDPIQPIDFTKYEGIHYKKALELIASDTQNKLNEIIKRVNEL